MTPSLAKFKALLSSFCIGICYWAWGLPLRVSGLNTQRDPFGEKHLFFCKWLSIGNSLGVVDEVLCLLPPQRWDWAAFEVVFKQLKCSSGGGAHIVSSCSPWGIWKPWSLSVHSERVEYVCMDCCLSSLWAQAADFVHLIATCDVCPHAPFPSHCSSGTLLACVVFLVSFLFRKWKGLQIRCRAFYYSLVRKG